MTLLTPSDRAWLLLLRCYGGKTGFSGNPIESPRVLCFVEYNLIDHFVEFGNLLNLVILLFLSIKCLGGECVPYQKLCLPIIDMGTLFFFYLSVFTKLSHFSFN